MKIDPTKLNWKDWNMTSIKDILATIVDNWLIKFVLGALIGINDWIFSPKQNTVAIVMAFIALDTISGFLKAVKSGTVSSSGFFRCGLKLLVYTILLAAGALLDRVSSVGAIISALSVTATYLSVTETISVCENITALGFKTPQNLMKILRVTQIGDDKNDSGSKKP